MTDAERLNVYPEVAVVHGWSLFEVMIRPTFRCGLRLPCTVAVLQFISSAAGEVIHVTAVWEQYATTNNSAL